MIIAWMMTGALCAAMIAFAATFALAFWVTGGSIWMLAFFPAFIGVPAAAVIPILAAIFRRDW